MFAPANQSPFELTIFGRQHDFKVLAFSGQETLNAPYAITVELVSEQADRTYEASREQYQPKASAQAYLADAWQPSADKEETSA